MALAYSYVRFSSKPQASGSSLQRQLDASKAFCLAHGLTLSETAYRDLGISAFKEKARASLEDMLSAIVDGTIKKGSYILIEALDRLSRRGISHTQDILKSILRHGVCVAFVGEDARTLSGTILTEDSLDDLTSVIMVSLAADLAHKESLRKAKLVLDAKARQRNKAKEGIPIAKRLPFWLKFEDGQYGFNEKISVIREIVSLRQKGYGSRKIAQHLNISGVDSPTVGKGWNHTTVRHVLTAPYLCGDYQTYKTIDGQLVPDVLIQDYFPAVVSRDALLILQGDQRNSAKGKVAKSNPFAGLLKCKCGGGFIYSLKKIKNKKSEMFYEYHHCLNSRIGLCERKGHIRDLIPVLKKVMSNLEIKTLSNNHSLAIQSNIDEKTYKIVHLNNLLLKLATPPISVLETISKLEAEVNELKISQQELLHVGTGINSTDIYLLSSLSDAREYNMHLKRLVESILILNSGKNCYSVKIKKRDGHSQSFIVQNGVIKMLSDSDRLKKWIKENADTSDA